MDPQYGLTYQILCNNSVIEINVKIVFNDKLFYVAFVYFSKVFDQNGKTDSLEKVLEYIFGPRYFLAFFWGLFSRTSTARLKNVLSRGHWWVDIKPQFLYGNIFKFISSDKRLFMLNICCGWVHGSCLERVVRSGEWLLVVIPLAKVVTVPCITICS